MASYAIDPTIERFAIVIRPKNWQTRPELRLEPSKLSCDRNLLTVSSITFEFP